MNDTIIMRVNKNLKDQLKKEAKGLNMTLSSYIKMIISKREK